MLGEKVILIDTDIGLRNLDVVMGLENRIVYNLVDVVENCRLKQALIKDKRYPNLFLLPSAQTRDKSSVTPGQMRKLVDDLREECDYVLLDCPAGIEQGFKTPLPERTVLLSSRLPRYRQFVTLTGSSACWRRKKSQRWISS